MTQKIRELGIVIESIPGLRVGVSLWNFDSLKSGFEETCVLLNAGIFQSSPKLTFFRRPVLRIGAANRLGFLNDGIDFVGGLIDRRE